MWGAGFKLGTSFIPGRYPFSFPSSINNYDFTDTGPNAGADSGKNEGRDLTKSGEPGFSTLQPVGFDLRLGGEAFYGFDAKNRLGAGVGLGFGHKYFDGCSRSTTTTCCTAATRSTSSAGSRPGSAR